MRILGKWHPLKEIMAWPRAISNPSISIVDFESLRNLYINFATEPAARNPRVSIADFETSRNLHKMFATEPSSTYAEGIRPMIFTGSFRK